MRCRSGLRVLEAPGTVCPIECDMLRPTRAAAVARLWLPARCVLGLVAGPPAHMWRFGRWEPQTRCVRLGGLYKARVQRCRHAP